MKAKINWFGLVGGIITLLVVLASLYIPWWQITVRAVGETIEGELVKAGFSSLNTNISILGENLTVPPLLWAANLTALLLLATSGAIMILYSLMPAKPYSKHLLGYAYKKPLFSVIFFTIPLVAIPLIVQTFLDVQIPVSGTATIALPTGLIGTGISIGFLVSTGFLWPFWLLIVGAGFCIAARIYHRKFTPSTTPPEVKPTDSAPAPASPQPAPPPPPPTPQPQETIEPSANN